MINLTFCFTRQLTIFHVLSSLDSRLATGWLPDSECLQLAELASQLGN